MKESFLDKHQMKIFWLTWGLIIACCIFIFFSNTVHAATGTTVLPYQANNNFNSISQEELDAVLSKIRETYPNADFSRIIVFKYGEGAWWEWSQYATIPFYTVYSFPEDFTAHTTWNGPGGTSSNFSNFELFNSNYNISLQMTGVTSYSYAHRNIGDYVDSWVLNEGNYKSFFGDATITTIQSPIEFSFNANYPVYTNFELRVQDPRLDYGIMVSPSGNGSPVVNGHATPPDFEGTGHSIPGSPNTKPTHPIIRPYTPSVYNPPSVDLTNVETLLKSIYDIIKYNHEYLTGELESLYSWLIGTIRDEVGYIVDTLQYLVQIIINNIQTGFQNLYDNFVSLFEPLLNGIMEFIGKIHDKLEEILTAITDYFSSLQERIEYAQEPLDTEEVISYYEETTVYEYGETIKSFTDGLKDTFTNVVPPQRLVFSVDFSNGPWPFNTAGRCEFNFDFYEGIRHTIVPWIIAFMYVGVILSLIQQIPNIIHGVAGFGWSTQQAHVEHMSGAEFFGHNWTHSFDASGYIGQGLGGGAPSTYREVNGWYGNWREV